MQHFLLRKLLWTARKVPEGHMQLADHILRAGAQPGGCLIGMPSPFNVCDCLAFENSMVHIEFQDSWLHGKAARLIPEKHEHIHFCIPPRSMECGNDFLNSTSLLWRAHAPVSRSFSTPTMFFCDATMYIYDDSTAFEPRSCWMWDCGLAATGHHTMVTSTSRPMIVTLFFVHPHGDSCLIRLAQCFSHWAAWSKCYKFTNRKTFLLEYLVYAIGYFFMYEWFGILELYAKTCFMLLTDM